MTQDITPAIIALIGVLVSAAISLATSLRITSTELRKLRTEIEQTYAGKLLEKRLETYPGLYHSLSEFVKVLEFGAVSKAYLQELRSHIEAWDSEYSLYFSDYTTNLFHEFRMFLAELTQLPEEDLQREYSSSEKVKALRDRVGEVELALKIDIGIYVVEDHGPKPTRY